MLDVDTTYKDLYNSSGGKKLRLIFYKEEYYVLYPSEFLFPSENLYPAEMSAESVDFEITDDEIQTDTLTIKSSITTNTDLDFGACECSQMELVVSGLSKDIAGKEFLLTQQFGNYEMALGVFTVDSTPKQEDKDTRKIIAYDRMKRFDNDVSGWYNLLDFPLTLKKFRDSLCNFVGVPQIETVLINDDIEVEKTLDPTALNGRDVMRYICQINGVFGNINMNGEFRYIAISKTEDVQSEITVYQSAESEEYTVPDIDTVQIRQEEGDIGGTSTGDGENVYIIEGNPLVYGKSTSELIQIANNIKSVISGLSYVPATISTNGSPWNEVGDRIKLKTTDGEINTLIMSRTLTGTQGMMDSYSSSGSQELTRQFNIETEILQVKGLSAVLKRTVEEVSNELTNLEDETNSKFVQTSQQISAEVTRASQAEAALSVRADNISASVTNLRNDTQSQFEATSEQISLKVSKGDVSSQLSVESGRVTISGNRLVVNSTNFKLDENGNATFSGAITGGTISTANGNFVVDANGNITIRGATIDGTTNTSSIGCNVMSANSANIDNLEVNGESNLAEVYANDIGCDQIRCTQIYSSVAGSWWSDKRLKHDVIRIDTDQAVKLLQLLNPVTFKLNLDDIPGAGFIAQEVRQICEDNCWDFPLYNVIDGFYGIPYTNFIPYMVAAIQEIFRRLSNEKNTI